MAKSNLPIEVHDHFQRANLLHGYFVKNLGEAKENALEIGQELLAAKAAIPHGSWESERERLFVGSARNARFYMSFAKDMLALPQNGRSAVLLLETTLEGAAKTAKVAAGAVNPPKPRKPRKNAPPVLAEPPKPDLGKCPCCAGTKWKQDDDGVWCAKCNHPHGEPAGDVDDKQLGIQRSKAIKTAEALMRAFDDLQTMKSNPHHEASIEGCKQLMKIARGWK
jgi:hypothetical protein